MLVGHGRAGKDKGCEYLSRLTGMPFAGTTSKYLTKYVAAYLGIDPEIAYRDRHQNRQLWYEIGYKLREKDPGILIREALANGPITGGVRDLAEIQVGRKEGLIDIVIWVHNNRVLPDPTVKFGPEDCDLAVDNHGTFDEYYFRLWRLAKFAGICHPSAAPEFTLSVAVPDKIHSIDWTGEAPTTNFSEGFVPPEKSEWTTHPVDWSGVVVPMSIPVKPPAAAVGYAAATCVDAMASVAERMQPPGSRVLKPDDFNRFIPSVGYDYALPEEEHKYVVNEVVMLHKPDSPLNGTFLQVRCRIANKAYRLTQLYPDTTCREIHTYFEGDLKSLTELGFKFRKGLKIDSEVLAEVTKDLQGVMEPEGKPDNCLFDVGELVIFHMDNSDNPYIGTIGVVKHIRGPFTDIEPVNIVGGPGEACFQTQCLHPLSTCKPTIYSLGDIVVKHLTATAANKPEVGVVVSIKDSGCYGVQFKNGQVLTQHHHSLALLSSADAEELPFEIYDSVVVFRNYDPHNGRVGTIYEITADHYTVHFDTTTKANYSGKHLRMAFEPDMYPNCDMPNPAVYPGDYVIVRSDNHSHLHGHMCRVQSIGGKGQLKEVHLKSSNGKYFTVPATLAIVVRRKKEWKGLELGQTVKIKNHNPPPDFYGGYVANYQGQLAKVVGLGFGNALLYTSDTGETWFNVKDLEATE